MCSDKTGYRGLAACSTVEAHDLEHAPPLIKRYCGGHPYDIDFKGETGINSRQTLICQGHVAPQSRYGVATV